MGDWIGYAAFAWLTVGWLLGIGNGYRGAPQTVLEHFGNAIFLPLVWLLALPFIICSAIIDLVNP